MSATEQAPHRESPPSVLLGSELPGAAAGIAVAAELLCSALVPFASVGIMSHRPSIVPSFTSGHNGTYPHIRLGTQPAVIHGEALLPGYVYRRRLASWSCGWAVGSRYAAAMFAAGLPYIVWEATTSRAELKAVDLRAARRAGRGSGIGALLHTALLPLDERLERMLYRGARAVFGMSEYSRDLISASSGICRDNIGLLPAPPRPLFIDALRAQCGQSKPPPVNGVLRLLLVGRVDDPRKNVGLLLGAYRRLRSSGTRVVLTIVGPHTEQWRHALRVDSVVEEITFTGTISVEALAAMFLSHDLLIVSSRQEGYGFTVIEALHAGLPVVSTRCGGPEHVIRESGAGVLVDHTDVAMAGAIAALAADPNRRVLMAKHAREYASRVLSLESFYSCVRSTTEGMLALVSCA
ncbi:MAG: glycosyltransferase family 4 protein [Gemmatimonadaceae bacterium]